MVRERVVAAGLMIPYPGVNQGKGKAINERQREFHFDVAGGVGALLSRVNRVLVNELSIAMRVHGYLKNSDSQVLIGWHAVRLDLRLEPGACRVRLDVDGHVRLRTVSCRPNSAANGTGKTDQQKKGDPVKQPYFEARAALHIFAVPGDRRPNSQRQ